MAGGHGSAGRPPRPVRPTPRRPGWFGCEDQVAWLMRTNRLYGGDDRSASLTDFAARFGGGSWPGPVSASQVSRWETAATRAGFAVLRRYEELLGLPESRLTVVADWTYRQVVGRAGPPVLDRRPVPVGRVEELLEQALSGAVMTGPWWDELTSGLMALPVVLLYPRTAWADLVERLLGELLIADGLRWMFRAEALARLMAHPRAGPAAVAACGSLAADPTNQIIVEPLTILDLTPDADANRHVLAQLASPTNDRALRGALLASVDKVSRRHFRPAQLRGLARVAVDLLSAENVSADARVLAAALLHQLPPGRLEPVYQRLRTAGDVTVRSVLGHGRTALPAMASEVVDRVCATARFPGAGDDPVLRRLVGELLFDPNQNKRLIAGFLIAATPYREPVGAALATELATTRTVPLAKAIIDAVPWVGRPADRDRIERFAVDTGLPAVLTETAAWKIAHAPGRSDGQFWRTALKTHAQAWQSAHDPGSMTALRGLVYGLGITHDETLLRELRGDADLPAPIRRAAAWWLNIPAHIVASAAR